MSAESHKPIADNSPAEDAASAQKRTQITRRGKVLAIAVLVLLALGATRTVISRMANSRVLEEGTADRAKIYVKVTVPSIGDTGQTLSLPGTLQGFVQSPIAARASGYLRRWYKDIGARVEKGELLAEIETPEIDQQLSQAVAARQQAAAGLDLARSSVDRWESLRKKDAVSQQELDERRSANVQAAANVAAADANVERLRQLEGFKRVVAPFAGLITRRNVDVGDLIDAGSSGGRPLFLLAQTDPLRVYVNVPQTYSQLIKPGQKVVVTQAELRGRTFPGEIARTAASIDAATRTMQIEVALPNRDGTLLPGAFVQVSLPLAANKAMVIPTTALLIRGDGISVAVVAADGRVHLQPVHIGRNYGETVEILDGVIGTEKLVLNPTDALAEGDQVTVVLADKTADNAGGKEAR